MNVLLDCDNRVKLGDLGLSTVIDKKIKTTAGTPLFLSPEQVRRLPYGFKVDIWALGCIIYYMAALEAPFLGDNLITLGNNIVQKPTPDIPTKYSNKLSEVINLLLQKESANRPSASEILRVVPQWLRRTYKAPTVVRVKSKREVVDVKDDLVRYKLKYRQCVDMAKCVRSSSTHPEDVHETASPERNPSPWIFRNKQQRRITTIRDLASL